MKHFAVVVEGTKPLLLNRFTDAAQMDATSATRGSTVGDTGSPHEQAEQKLYTDENGTPIVPGPNLFRCLIEREVVSSKATDSGLYAFVPRGSIDRCVGYSGRIVGPPPSTSPFLRTKVHRAGSMASRLPQVAAVLASANCCPLLLHYLLEVRDSLHGIQQVDQRLHRLWRASPVAVRDRWRSLIHGVASTRRNVRTNQPIPRYQRTPKQNSSFSNRCSQHAGLNAY